MDLFGKKAAKRVQDLERILEESQRNSDKKIRELETLLAGAEKS